MLVRSPWVAGHKAKFELIWGRKWVFINSHSLMTGRAIGQLGTMTNQGFGVTNQRFQIPLELCCSPSAFLFDQHTSHSSRLSPLPETWLS